MCGSERVGVVRRFEVAKQFGARGMEREGVRVEGQALCDAVVRFCLKEQMGERVVQTVGYLARTPSVQHAVERVRVIEMHDGTRVASDDTRHVGLESWWWWWWW